MNTRRHFLKTLGAFGAMLALPWKAKAESHAELAKRHGVELFRYETAGDPSPISHEMVLDKFVSAGHRCGVFRRVAPTHMAGVYLGVHFDPLARRDGEPVYLVNIREVGSVGHSLGEPNYSVIGFDIGRATDGKAVFVFQEDATAFCS